jgi:hypothetical protein
MVQSVVALYKDIKRLGWKEAIASQDEFRLQNISKALADLLTMIALLILGYFASKGLDKLKKDLGLKDTDAELGLYKEVERGTVNAFMDMMPLAGVTSVMDGSAMAAMGKLYTSAKSAVTLVYYGASGDLDAAQSRAKSLFMGSGSFRTVRGVYGLTVKQAIK